MFTEERYKRLHECRLMAVEANKKPVLVYCAGGAQYFESKTEAGKALDVSITTISRLMNRGYCQRRGAGIVYANDNGEEIRE